MTERLEQLPTPEEECFFIAPIGVDGSDERRRSNSVLEHIVSDAARALDLVAVRADRISRPGSISLQVIDHVLGAKAAVADLTGSNANVYYELAVRHTARLPTVLIAEVGTTLPFDIGQMRTIFFDHRDLASAAACRTQIIAQLRAAMDGAVDSPVATAVDLRAMHAGSSLESIVADLVAAVDLSRAEQQSAVESLLDVTSRIRDINEVPKAAGELQFAKQLTIQALTKVVRAAQTIRFPGDVSDKVQRMLTHVESFITTAPTAGVTIAEEAHIGMTLLLVEDVASLILVHTTSADIGGMLGQLAYHLRNYADSRVHNLSADAMPSLDNEAKIRALAELSAEVGSTMRTTGSQA